MLAGARLLLLVGSAAAFVARGPAPLSPHAPAAARSGAVLAKKKAEEEGLYSDTVSLPQTSFSQRAMAATREPELQQFWSEKRVYERLCETNSGEPFTLHDGPPYANGDLHIGHALNKVLKDVINKYQLLRGRKARFVPGWDCHGLPIELKVNPPPPLLCSPLATPLAAAASLLPAASSLPPCSRLTRPSPSHPAPCRPLPARSSSR